MKVNLTLNDDQDMPNEPNNIRDIADIIGENWDFKLSNWNNDGEQISEPGPSNQIDPILPSIKPEKEVYVKIIEEPSPTALRFRYNCEVLGISAGSIKGATSTPENKTFPTIQVVGYKGRAIVIVSCVTKDPPYRPHPHNIVGREGCGKGVCIKTIDPKTMLVSFTNLGILCAKRKDIQDSLKVREKIKVDPFKTGFSHRNQPNSINLNAVRLCFQVLLEGDTPGKYTIPLDPVVSQIIYDRKKRPDLVITNLSDCVSYVDGGRKNIILLCEKIEKEDIQIRFYEEKDGIEVWEGFATFEPSQIHKHVAISFRPPRYHDLNITESVRVNIQLRRISDGACSKPVPFEYVPLDPEPGSRKRRKKDEHLLFKRLEEANRNQFTLNIPNSGTNVEPTDASLLTYTYPWYSQNVTPQYPSTSSTSFQDATNTNILENIPTTVSDWNIGVGMSNSNTLESWNNINSGLDVNIRNVLSGLNNVNNNFDQILLNLDTEQSTELQPVEMNINELNIFQNLSGSLNANLTLSDMNFQEQNLTDSFRLLSESINNPNQPR